MDDVDRDANRTVCQLIETRAFESDRVESNLSEYLNIG